MVLTKMKRDIQGKFALKNDDYRLVRSLRLTDRNLEGWYCCRMQRLNQG